MREEPKCSAPEPSKLGVSSHLGTVAALAHAGVAAHPETPAARTFRFGEQVVRGFQRFFLSEKEMALTADENAVPVESQNGAEGSQKPRNSSALVNALRGSRVRARATIRSR